MGRITSYESSKQFVQEEGIPIFNLADDGDQDRVQFLLNSLDDILIYTVHNIPALSQSGKQYDRKVGCLKTSPHDPEGTCPLCDCGNKLRLSRFIPMYSHNQGKVVLWERSGQYIEKNIAPLLNRFKSEGVSATSKVIEITRVGKKGDMKTTYNFYPLTVDPVDVQGLSIPDPEDGGLIAKWSTADMIEYRTTGNMPSAGNEGVQRREARQPDPNAGMNPAAYAPPTTPTANDNALFGGVAISNPESMF